MTERGTERLTAWARELRAVHLRLREALDIVRDAVEADDPGPDELRDLLLYCHGFCAALTGHHGAEDRVLFPAIAAEHPELADTLRALTQDHSMIAHLIAGMEHALDSSAPPDELQHHLDGIGAIMESHFRYEERALDTVLMTLDFEAAPTEALGPL